MEAQTILAKLSIRIVFSEAAQQWLAQARKHQLWLAENGGRLFFAQFRTTWEQTLVEACEPLVRDFFTEAGCSPEELPQVKVVGSSSGSWNMKAVVMVEGMDDKVLTLPSGPLKSTELVTRLSRLQPQLERCFSELMNCRVRERLDFPTGASLLPPLPVAPIEAEFQLDSEPLLTILSHH